MTSTKPLLFVISGPSGAGKSSIMRALAEDLGLERLKTFTTRPRRRGERDDYEHITSGEFETLQAAGALAEVTERYGHRYGSPSSALGAARGSAIVSLDVTGLKWMLAHTPGRRVVSLLVTASSPVGLQQRMKVRDSSEQRTLELSTREVASYAAHAELYDWIIVNDTSLEEAYIVARSMVAAELLRTDNLRRLNGEVLATRSARALAAWPTIVVKAAIVCDGKVLVLRPGVVEHDAQRDLPGGKLRVGRDPIREVRREVLEETGLEVEVLGPLRVWSFRDAFSGVYLGITFVCTAPSGASVLISDEHVAAQWLAVDEVPEDWPERAELVEAIHCAVQGMPGVGASSAPAFGDQLPGG